MEDSASSIAAATASESIPPSALSPPIQSERLSRQLSLPSRSDPHLTSAGGKPLVLHPDPDQHDLTQRNEVEPPILWLPILPSNSIACHAIPETLRTVVSPGLPSTLWATPPEGPLSHVYAPFAPTIQDCYPQGPFSDLMGVHFDAHLQHAMKHPHTHHLVWDYVFLACWRFYCIFHGRILVVRTDAESTYTEDYPPFLWLCHPSVDLKRALEADRTMARTKPDLTKLGDPAAMDAYLLERAKELPSFHAWFYFVVWYLLGMYKDRGLPLPVSIGPHGGEGSSEAPKPKAATGKKRPRPDTPADEEDAGGDESSVDEDNQAILPFVEDLLKKHHTRTMRIMGFRQFIPQNYVQVLKDSLGGAEGLTKEKRALIEGTHDIRTLEMTFPKDSKKHGAPFFFAHAFVRPDRPTSAYFNYATFPEFSLPALLVWQMWNHPGSANPMPLLHYKFGPPQYFLATHCVVVRHGQASVHLPRGHDLLSPKYLSPESWNWMAATGTRWGIQDLQTPDASDTTGRAWTAWERYLVDLLPMENASRLLRCIQLRSGSEACGVATLVHTFEVTLEAVQTACSADDRHVTECLVHCPALCQWICQTWNQWNGYTFPPPACPSVEEAQLSAAGVDFFMARVLGVQIEDQKNPGETPHEKEARREFARTKARPLMVSFLWDYFFPRTQTTATVPRPSSSSLSVPPSSAPSTPAPRRPASSPPSSSLTVPGPGSQPAAKRARLQEPTSVQAHAPSVVSFPGTEAVLHSISEYIRNQMPVLQHELANQPNALLQRMDNRCKQQLRALRDWFLPPHTEDDVSLLNRASLEPSSRHVDQMRMLIQLDIESGARQYHPHTRSKIVDLAVRHSATLDAAKALIDEMDAYASVLVQQEVTRSMSNLLTSPMLLGLAGPSRSVSPSPLPPIPSLSLTMPFS